MATNSERAQNFCNALLGRVTTNAEVNRIAISYARNGNRYEEYQAANADGKARILIEEARKITINIVKATEAQAAAQLAANNAIINTDADFAES